MAKNGNFQSIKCLVSKRAALQQSNYGTIETTQRSSNPYPEKSKGIPAYISALLIVALAFGFLLSANYIGTSKYTLNILKATGTLELEIPQGRLRGVLKQSRRGRNFTAYYKVPYAEPPIGLLRFSDPIKPQAGWTGGVREISSVGPKCIQAEKYQEIWKSVGEEDCLYANIYVPDILVTESLLPVMVFVHGGQFVDGYGGQYGPEYFMDEDVILITFEFRVGPFGFLSTGDEQIHGNMGFKDQVQMLKWIKDNIKYFGGDPNKVTAFGNSGGGIGVNLMMVSRMGKGLFQRAISQSGSIYLMAPAMMLDRDPQKTVDELGSIFNCTTTNTTEFLNCMRTKEAAEISVARNSPAKYSLTLEKHSNDEQIFMADFPYKALRTHPSPIPYILGINSDELTHDALTSVLLNQALLDALNQDWINTAKLWLNLPEIEDEATLKIKEFYFGNQSVGNTTFHNITNLISDRYFNHCLYTSAKIHSESGPAYLYYLSKPPKISYADNLVPGFVAKEHGMVTHTDELSHLFNIDGFPEITNDDKEYFEFSKYMVSTWVEFAKTGKPQAEWQEADADRQNNIFWFELNDKPGRTDKLTERMIFWDKFTHQQLKYE